MLLLFGATQSGIRRPRGPLLAEQEVFLLRLGHLTEF